jgi:hypothetical protein
LTVVRDRERSNRGIAARKPYPAGQGRVAPCGWWSAGIWPNRQALKSSNAVSTSALVFITNGPPQAIGSRIGVPPSASGYHTSDPGATRSVDDGASRANAARLVPWSRHAGKAGYRTRSGRTDPRGRQEPPSFPGHGKRVDGRGPGRGFPRRDRDPVPYTSHPCCCFVTMTGSHERGTLAAAHPPPGQGSASLPRTKARHVCPGLP